MNLSTQSPEQQRLWAVTCYFPFDDPKGDKRRLRVYREFRKHLEIPLITVELSMDQTFDLDDRDAEVLIQIANGPVLWQKERLLNIAISALPSHCDSVAWLDCDVVFLDADWADAARVALRNTALVQLFRRALFLAEDALPTPVCPEAAITRLDSIAYRHVNALIPDYAYGGRGVSIPLGQSPGMAWAAPKSLLDQCALYDGAILGGADKMMFAAACARWHDSIEAFSMSRSQALHFELWARRFHELVGTKIGHLDGDICHLWHGGMASRNYSNRYDGFEVFDFDPERDLERRQDGAWQWASNKPALHDFVRAQFERRRSTSDGRDSKVANL